jgi:D-arabinose 1-dehydrogenase-like Zn-dependent alcohol dehydrogenase
MPTMKALVRHRDTVALRNVPVPDPGADEVRVRVALAGLCRTDIQVATGELSVAEGLVLGHEFAGTVDAVGLAVRHLHVGERVAIQPVLGCLACPICSDDEINCPERRMLGVDRDGAFAECVVVPSRYVYPLPHAVSLHAAAYAEPIAAALGVLGAGLPPREPGLILGRNRFSTLLERLLRAEGFTSIAVYDPSAGDPDPCADAFAFVIETELKQETLSMMLRCVRPRGTVVLKSRQPARVDLDVRAALRKQVTIRAVNYGSFRRGLVLLAEGALDLAGLTGPAYPLEAFREVFALAGQSETVKLFFRPAPASGIG